MYTSNNSTTGQKFDQCFASIAIIAKQASYVDKLFCDNNESNMRYFSK